MGSVWCVKPESTKINLEYVAPDGLVHPFWISVKKRLNVGEDKHVMTSGFRMVMAKPGVAPTPGEMPFGLEVDWTTQSYARTQEYLLDWSLADDDGTKLDVRSLDVVKSLEPELYRLIETALTAHIEAMVQEKKATAGRSTPSMRSA